MLEDGLWSRRIEGTESWSRSRAGRRGRKRRHRTSGSRSRNRLRALAPLRNPARRPRPEVDACIRVHICFRHATHWNPPAHRRGRNSSSPGFETLPPRRARAHAGRAAEVDGVRVGATRPRRVERARDPGRLLRPSIRDPRHRASISPSRLVRVAQARAARAGLSELVRFERGDSQHLSFPDASFDAVINQCAVGIPEVPGRRRRDGACRAPGRRGRDPRVDVAGATAGGGEARALRALRDDAARGERVDRDAARAGVCDVQSESSHGRSPRCSGTSAGARGPVAFQRADRAGAAAHRVAHRGPPRSRRRREGAPERARLFGALRSRKIGYASTGDAGPGRADEPAVSASSSRCSTRRSCAPWPTVPTRAPEGAARRRPSDVGTIAARVPQERSVVSRHLKVLLDAESSRARARSPSRVRGRWEGDPGAVRAHPGAGEIGRRGVLPARREAHRSL